MPLNPDQQAKFDIVCERIAEGMSLRSACDFNDVPTRHAIRKWLNNPENGAAVTQYARAREERADFHADEIISIADDGSNDWVKDDAEGYKLNGEHVQRSRLRVDSRKWIASKLQPKTYGDKQEVAVTGGVTINLIENFAPKLPDDG